MALQPVCEEPCEWRGEETLDIADAKRQCEEHWRSTHQLDPEMPLMVGGLF